MPDYGQMFDPELCKELDEKKNFCSVISWTLTMFLLLQCTKFIFRVLSFFLALLLLVFMVFIRLLTSAVEEVFTPSYTVIPESMYPERVVMQS